MLKAFVLCLNNGSVSYIHFASFNLSKLLGNNSFVDLIQSSHLPTFTNQEGAASIC